MNSARFADAMVNRRPVRRLGLIASVLLFAGCPSEQPTTVDAAVAEVPDASQPVDAGPIDAGPPAPVELAFPIDFLGVDGGLVTVQSGAGSADIDPARQVFLSFPVPLKDYRVRMFDGAEQVLPSDEEARVEDGGLMTYRITLAAPLKPGRSYAFGVESELGHEITDINGRGYRDIRLSLKVRGTPEPEPKAGKTKKRKK